MSDEPNRKDTGRFVKVTDFAPDKSKAETKAECPACHGKGLISFEEKVALLINYPDLEPPPPSSKPEPPSEVP